MSRINRGTGTTESERFLAQIAEKSFLNLWTYPNVFRDQHINGSSKGDGKELCDVLVVCGDDVVIFSDKTVNWCADKATNIAWCRWYKAAIEKSADQIQGAMRWLREHPRRIFIDKSCTVPLPIVLPPPERMRVHGVVIAVGANDVIIAGGGHHFGILSIDSSIRGRQHRDIEAPGFRPFVIGDIDPDRAFVHVFDQRAMDLVLQTENTITDFTDYLTRRAIAIRNQRIGQAMGEDDLLGFYMSRTRPTGEHDFIRNSGAELLDGERVKVPEYFFQYVLDDPGFRQKQAGDEISFLWDHLITMFSDHLLAGTSVSPTGGAVDVSEGEVVLQTMARESRLNRRLFSTAIDGAIKRMIVGKEPRFVRFLLPHETSVNKALSYVFLMMDYPAWMDPTTQEGELEYRVLRRTTLMIYCLSILMEHPTLEVCIGISMNAPPQYSGRVGGSEDVALFRPEVLTDELKDKVHKARKDFNIMPNYKGTLDANHISVDEYPGN